MGQVSNSLFENVQGQMEQLHKEYLGKMGEISTQFMNKIHSDLTGVSPAANAPAQPEDVEQHLAAVVELVHDIAKRLTVIEQAIGIAEKDT